MQVTITDHKGLAGAEGGVWTFEPTEAMAEAFLKLTELSAPMDLGSAERNRVAALAIELADVILIESERRKPARRLRQRLLNAPRFGPWLQLSPSAGFMLGQPFGTAFDADERELVYAS